MPSSRCKLAKMPRADGADFWSRKFSDPVRVHAAAAAQMRKMKDDTGRTDIHHAPACTKPKCTRKTGGSLSEEINPNDPTLTASLTMNLLNLFLFAAAAAVATGDERGHDLLRKLCASSGAGCKKDSDCCPDLTCEGSGNRKRCTAPPPAPVNVDLCEGVQCSGNYETCDPSTGQCDCIHDIDEWPNCLGDLPCEDDAECPCDDTIFYPCPIPDGFSSTSVGVRGDCSKMRCNPNYRGGVGSPDITKCLCDAPYHKFQIADSWPSCTNCCEQSTSGWPNYCYKYPDTNSYLPISCPVCTDTTDPQYPQALKFECTCSEGGVWPECANTCSSTPFPSHAPTPAPMAKPTSCASAGVNCNEAETNGLACCNGCQKNGNPNSRKCL